METKFTHNGITLLFYKKENDVKYSFKIENDEELTQKILQTVSTKRVNEKAIFYAKEAIFKLINTNKLKTQNIMENPIIKLSELCQRIFGENIQTRVISKQGADHCPTIWVEIELPNGDIYKASGNNQKIAKQKAASEALKAIEE